VFCVYDGLLSFHLTICTLTSDIVCMGIVVLCVLVHVKLH
jgi:hypothetical protein